MSSAGMFWMCTAFVRVFILLQGSQSEGITPLWLIELLLSCSVFCLLLRPLFVCGLLRTILPSMVAAGARWRLLELKTQAQKQRSG